MGQPIIYVGRESIQLPLSAFLIVRFLFLLSESRLRISSVVRFGETVLVNQVEFLGLVQQCNLAANPLKKGTDTSMETNKFYCCKGSTM